MGGEFDHDVHYNWSRGDRIFNLCSSKLIEQTLKNTGVSRGKASLFFLILLTVAFISIPWINSTGPGTILQRIPRPSRSRNASKRGGKFQCSLTCPEYSPAITNIGAVSSPEACPEYFRWIHEDLNPWKEEGVTEEMVEESGKTAHIRIVIVKGRMYVKKYKWNFQTRDVFTVWGILQLLRLYPGKLPDLDMMFECGDKPKVNKSDYINKNGSKAAQMPPLFHYCGSDSTLDIPFPDWSFWGWPEINIQPWETLRKELEKGNQRVKWEEREPYAYWKGTTSVSPCRKELLDCNVTDKEDWNARIYELDWRREREEGYKNTDLAEQCTYRYKIYVEGNAWSVSQKYILACDSVSLVMNSHYYDFFTRSLVPTVHYWPINERDKCRSIKFAVDWGNINPQKAQEIGKAGSKFILEDLKMKNVYDYMFHLLSEYGKLLRYQPCVPQGAIEVCSETLACSSSGRGLKNRFKRNSLVPGPADSSPCTMPPPYDPPALHLLLQRNSNLTDQVERWKEAAR